MVIIQLISIPSFLDSSDLQNALVLQATNDALNPDQSQAIAELLKNRTLLTLDDVWGFQSSFYQTIIGILLGLLALISAFAVIYIRSNSLEKAEEYAEKYLKGGEFNSLINKKTEETLQHTRHDFDESVKNFDHAAQEYLDLKFSLDRIENSQSDIKRNITIVSRRLSKIDHEEDTGKELNLEFRKESE
jgi:hypothetical protein